ncbi:AAA family ATPase [Virgibacillus halophilus]|uniref:AAA family ATPase n=1 Tax=Tigheibacillus halophilus TaxID=361280 RepID=A0ABU5C9W1_9BACI|nr:AAA family ATPase [Virgibacillus halophilus]
MKIKHAYIYGFGKWVDFSFDFSNGNFQLVYGENESGKSTLHHFLLFMFFGLSPKERAFFHPKTSSRLGGRLVVADETYGEYIIERVEQHKKGRSCLYNCRWPIS